MKQTALFSLVFFSLTVFACAQTEKPWNLRKDKEGIKVYTRQVEGSPILEFKAATAVNASLDKVTSLYDQENRLPEWFYQCTEARLLKEISPAERIVYFVLNMPWPVSNRDSAYLRVKSAGPDGEVIYRLSALPGEYPKQPGRVRVPYLKTEWRFKSLPDGRTEVFYQQHSDAGGHIPSMLVNQLVVDIPFNTLKNFRKLLEESK